MLLHRRLGQARYADAVAAHPQGLVHPGLIGEGGFEGGRILAAQLENVPHLDATAGFKQLRWVVQAAIARLGGAQIDHLLRCGQSVEPAPAHPNPMLVEPVGSTDEGLQGSGGGVHQAQERALQAGAAVSSFRLAGDTRRAGGKIHHQACLVQNRIRQIRPDEAQRQGRQIQRQTFAAQQLSAEGGNPEQCAVFSAQALSS
jgi:hypothetical protein